MRFDPSRSGKVDALSFKTVASELRAKIVDTDLVATMKWFDTDGSQLLDYNALCRQVYGEDVSTEKLCLPRIKETKSFTALAKMLNSSTFGSTIEDPPFRQALPTDGRTREFGLASTILSKNMDLIESEAVKLARMKMKRSKILAEKRKVEKKIESVDEQRKMVIDNFKAARAAKFQLTS